MSLYVPRYIVSKEIDGYVYIVLEYIDGIGFDNIDLNNILLEDRLSICEALNSILDGLIEIDYSHNDIRLQNFMLREGRPVLFDFGYACKKNEIVSMLSTLSNEEKKQLNEYNRISYDKHNDAFSMFYVMKHINPSLLSNQKSIWESVNQRIGDL
ncbi:hypothetical protein [Butyrivibrio sp. AE2032]|uniref:hypothetical protein n=1 Tax=Butyrivibrio sp. AE2032 TaxID=1458463 RepID=UPI001639F7B2|nr:hypothetical protein [Butyrivibrio sp. AE2032]